MLLLLACTDPLPDSKAPAETAVPAVTYAEPPDAWVDALDTFAKDIKQSLRGANGTGAQYAVWYDGAIIYSGSVGTKDPDTDELPGVDTLYEIGSDTKKLTAIALLQAVARGDVGLDDPVSAALPDLTLTKEPTWADTATIRQLLSHQTGLYDYTPWVDDPADDALGGRIDGTFSTNEYTFFPPGAGHAYANPNYAIAGRAIENLTGRSWADVVGEDILAPLGLTHSYTREADAEAAGDVAIGTGYTTTVTDWPYDPFAGDYGWVLERVPLDVHPDNAFLRPAGSVWSTAEDQARLMGALTTGFGDVLSDELLAEMTRAQVELYPGMDGVGYGLGLYVQGGYNSAGDTWVAEPIWKHGGATLSYSSASYALPNRRVAVSILTNGYGDYPNAALGGLLETIAADAPVESYASIVPPEVDPATYAGSYSAEQFLGTFTLTATDTALTLDAPELDAAGIPYKSVVTLSLGTLLVAEINGMPVYWSVYEDGGTTWLIDRTFAARKM